jgi:hypothetical protein
MIWLALIFNMIASAVPYTMNDVGGTLDLPAAWKGKAYSDTDLSAELPDRRGKLMFRMWMTGYQVPLDEVSGAAFADDYARRLGTIGGSNTTLVSQEVRSVAGRPTQWSVQHFKNKSGAKLMAQTAAIAGNGNVVHLRIWSGEQQQVQMKSALGKMLQAFTLTKPAGALSGGTLSAEDGFETTLPEGWRVPVGKEIGRVSKITSKLWVSKKGTEPCWVGIRPVPIGKPDVMFACGRSWAGGPVDEHSLGAVDSELRELYFRAASSEVPPAEAIAVGDRMGLIYKPREGVNALRLVTAPYDKGLMTLWAQAGSLSDAALDAAVASVAAQTRFTGPDGGKPIIRGDKWVGYYLVHRPMSPIVVVPALGLIGIIGFFVARRKKSGPQWDDLTEV